MLIHEHKGRLVLAAMAAAGMITVGSTALISGTASAVPQAGSGAIAPATSPAITPATGSPVPATASGCVGTLPTDNDETCIYITGTGTYVKFIEGSVTVRRGDTTGHLELYGPKGLIKNSKTGSLYTITVGYVWWTPHANEPKGTYCAETWLKTSKGYTSAGVACESVT